MTPRTIGLPSTIAPERPVDALITQPCAGEPPLTRDERVRVGVELMRLRSRLRQLETRCAYLLAEPAT